MKSLRTIADLKKYPHAIDEISRKWDFVAEIENWSVELVKRGIQWRTNFVWNESRREERFHPSSFAKKCDYYLFSEMVGSHKEYFGYPSERATYDTGTCYHLMMNYYTESRAALFDYTHVTEFEIHDFQPAKKLRLCGSADGMEERQILDYNIRIIQEWKTISDNGYKSLGNRAKLAHVRQTHAYMYAADIPLSLIVYINKNTTAKRAYLFGFDESCWSPIMERLQRLYNLALNLKEPERHITNSCKYCSFRKECSPKLNNASGGKRWLRAEKKRERIPTKKRRRSNQK